MGAVKFLEKKSVIQLFGLIIILSPFLNILAIQYNLDGFSNKWTWDMYWKIAFSVPKAKRILEIIGIIIGFNMLSGSSKSWKYILLVLSGHIALQTGNFQKEVLKNWLAMSSFAINILAFGFIAYYFIWKEEVVVEQSKSANSKKINFNAELNRTPTAVAQQTRTVKSIPIAFEGFGLWAQLVSISKSEIHVRSTTVFPLSMENREIEFVLKSGLVLRAQLAKQNGNDFYFQLVNVDPAAIKAINDWLISRSMAA